MAKKNEDLAALIPGEPEDSPADAKERFVAKVLTVDDPSPCKDCKWRGDEKHRLQCAAFPKGIPMGVLSGKNKHRKPIDDEIVVFEAK